MLFNLSLDFLWYDYIWTYMGRFYGVFWERWERFYGVFWILYTGSQCYQLLWPRFCITIGCPTRIETFEQLNLCSVVILLTSPLMRYSMVLNTLSFVGLITSINRGRVPHYRAIFGRDFTGFVGDSTSAYRRSVLLYISRTYQWHRCMQTRHVCFSIHFLSTPDKQDCRYIHN
jgi:hypothetical protein